MCGAASLFSSANTTFRCSSSSFYESRSAHKDSKTLKKKLLYLICANPEFCILFVIALADGQKDHCVFIMVGQYVGLFGVVQPLLHLFSRHQQATHTFLAGKYFIISATVLAVLAVHETTLLQQSAYFGLLYPTLFLFYVLTEIANPIIIKSVYSLLLLHSENDLFKYPKRLSASVSQLKSETFFEFAKNAQTKKMIEQVRTSNALKKSNSKYFGLWQILKTIIRARDQMETEELRQERQKKIQSHYQSLLVEKQSKIDEAHKQRVKVREERLTNLNSVSQMQVTQLDQHNSSRQDGHQQSAELLHYLASRKENSKTKDSCQTLIFGSVYHILKSRFNSLEWPDGFLQKASYVFFFPFHFSFTMMIPNMKIKVSIRQGFFGLLACFILMIGMTILIYLSVNDSARYWKINPGLTGLIYSLLGLNYLIYCASLGVSANRFFNISIQEMLIVQATLLMTISCFNDILFTKLTLNLSLQKMVYPLAVLLANSFLFSILSFIFAEGIPWLILQLFAVIPIGYIVLMTASEY